MRTGLPKVAVLMATYNGEKYLHQQMDSVLGQENVDVSVFVRDDRSSDTTVAIIQEYSRQTGKVFLLDTVEHQLYAAKNFMSLVRDVDLSGMDYMAYCDQDDIWLPRKLHAAVTAITEQQADCYASNLLMGDADAKVVANKSLLSKLVNYIFNYKTSKKLPYDFYFESASAGCTLVLNRQAALYLQKMLTEWFAEIPVRASHDWSTYAITRLQGFDWYIDHQSYIIYRQHAENAYGANQGWNAVSKLLELFTSGWYRQHILMIDSLYNKTGMHPAFIETVKNYRHASISSRFRMAFAIAKYRRKIVHKIMLFFLIIFGYCK
jgi:rhamnosyltransferase